MYISEIQLAGFRNIQSAGVEFSSGINILYGDNAQGKTNILESIYVCATGRSYRTKIDSQLISFNEKEAHLKAFVVKEKVKDRVDVHIRGDKKKGIAINGIPIKKSVNLFGTLYVVIFSPEDLQLIKNSPIERRRFIDMEMCQLSNVHYYDLQQYYKILKQRNNLLKEIPKKPKLKETVSVWDTQLIEYGKKIIENREKFVKHISNISGKIHGSISENKETLEIHYKPNSIAEEYGKKIKNSLEKDIFYGSTSYGPHKDDIMFCVDSEDVRVYGSQGQQRTAALSAKLAEVEVIKEKTGYYPILLLDDVLSELDEKRQFFLLDRIKETQTIITCTGIEDTIKKYMEKSFIFNVENGKIINEKKQ